MLQTAWPLNHIGKLENEQTRNTIRTKKRIQTTHISLLHYDIIQNVQFHIKLSYFLCLVFSSHVHRKHRTDITPPPPVYMPPNIQRGRGGHSGGLSGLTLLPPPVHMPPNIQRGGGGGCSGGLSGLTLLPPLPSTSLLTSNGLGGGALWKPFRTDITPPSRPHAS